MKYTVSYKEVIKKNIIVEADSNYEAREKVLHAIDLNYIDLSEDVATRAIGCCLSKEKDFEKYPTLEECMITIEGEYGYTN